MFVMNWYTLISVNLLNFIYQILLSFSNSFNFKKFLWISWALNYCITSWNLIAIFKFQTGNTWNQMNLFCAIISYNGYLSTSSFIFPYSDNSRNPWQSCLAFGSSCFEQLDYTRQTCRNISSSSSYTTRMESSHSQLCPWLTNWLSSYYSHCFTYFYRLAGC